MFTRKILCFLLFFVGGLGSSFAQQGAIHIDYKVNDDQTIAFFYRKNVPGSYTLKFKFNQLQNTSFYDTYYIANSAYGRLFTLRPTMKERNISFYSFSFSFTKGDAKAKPDADFAYAFPFKDGTEFQVTELANLQNSLFHAELPKNWKSLRFTPTNSDEVLAVRDGIIIETVDSYPRDSVSYFTTQRNQVTVEHPDGSLATYTGFGNKRVSVKIGDVITKETVLGYLKEINSGYQNALSLAIYSLTDPQFEIETATSVSEQKSAYTYVSPKFMSSTGLMNLTNNMKYSVDGRLNEPEQKSQQKRKRRN